ncbi:MAG: hypothetical protein KGK15_10100 [Burkholderiales bacterium]|nr:hypothetical protein [Burkholderiales bacterium]
MDVRYEAHTTRCPMVQGVVAACVNNRFQPRIVYESTDPQTILSLVSVGVGASILPQSLAAIPREDVVFVPLDGRKLNANLYATYRRDDCLPALDLFLGVLRDATLAWRREKFGA